MLEKFGVYLWGSFWQLLTNLRTRFKRPENSTFNFCSSLSLAKYSSSILNINNEQNKFLRLFLVHWRIIEEKISFWGEFDLDNRRSGNVSLWIFRTWKYRSILFTWTKTLVLMVSKVPTSSWLAVSSCNLFIKWEIPSFLGKDLPEF